MIRDDRLFSLLWVSSGERANFTTLNIQCISSLLSLSRLDVLSTFLGLSTEQSALLAELRMSLCE